MEKLKLIQCESAEPGDLPQVHEFLEPFFQAQLLLNRSEDDLKKLLNIAFVVRVDGQVVGFAALEIYSRKLAEIQCLAVDSNFQGQGIGQLLVNRCVAAAKREEVLELMAISNAEGLFRRCGFDYSLPNQKRALFISPGEH